MRAELMLEGVDVRLGHGARGRIVERFRHKEGCKADHVTDAFHTGKGRDLPGRHLWLLVDLERAASLRTQDDVSRHVGLLGIGALPGGERRAGAEPHLALPANDHDVVAGTADHDVDAWVIHQRLEKPWTERLYLRQGEATFHLAHP